jgi:putative SOS response-associated peptidase YedK
MCGRYTLASDLSEFLEQLGIEAPEELLHPRRYNIAPSQPVLALIGDPEPRLEVMEWGFIPSWAKPGQEMKPVINARADSMIDKPYFRGAFRNSRCAVLADGFYEWQKVGSEKHPFRIGLKDGGVFAMAGLWSMTHGGDGSERPTCAIVTVEPNDLMRSIHDRMPALLRTEDIPLGLDRMTQQRDLLTAIEPFPAERMRAYEVSRAVNSPANDLPDCIKAIEDED